MGLVITMALIMAGLNLIEKNRNEVTVSNKENSLLVSLLYGEDDIETVTNETPVVSEKRLSPITIANAAPLSAEDAALASADEQLPTSIADNQMAILAKDTLVRGNAVETRISVKPRETIIKYTIKEGDTISSIAKKFDIDEATILEENKKYVDEVIKPGEQLSILPLSGATERIEQGESLAKIAEKHGVKVEDVVEFNKLKSPEDIAFAQILIIPDGKRETKSKPQPVVSRASDRLIASNYSQGYTRNTSRGQSRDARPVVRTSSNVGNHFPWGWCTWYVAQKRGDVGWHGNAGTWLNGARGSGKSTGRIPAVGSIMVTGESGYGHVAYVEAVNGDQVTVSEMNYRGFGVVSKRTLSSKNRVIKGFVY